MNARTIYPDDFAAVLMKRAGQKYQPSNGTEGHCFISQWCGECARDKAMREGANYEDCDDSEVCDIIGKTFAFNVEDAEYPKEWQYGKDGQPCCTAFVLKGETIPPEPDTFTIDMFAGQPDTTESGK